MCWTSLENIGTHIGQNCPRLWLVIGQYKNGAKFLTFLVVILQLVRISFVGYEWKLINAEYPQAETIAFCFLSILLGFVSLGLEGLLLYAMQTNNLKKIQPWFLCTVLIFLTASLAFVITGTLYVIRPIDHNIHLDSLNQSTNTSKSSSQSDLPLLNKNNNLMNDTGRRLGREKNLGANVNRPSIPWTTDSFDYMMEEGVSSSTETSPDVDPMDVEERLDCAPNNLTCIKLAEGDMDKDKNVTKWARRTRAINSRTNMTDNEVFENEKATDVVPIPSSNSGESGSFMSKPAGVCTNPAASNKTSIRAAAQAKKGRKSINYIMRAHNETYAVHPILPLSYLLDVVRCIPQLFLVNRFVKAEQLHEHLIHPSHSHTSLSALYVKPLPVLV